MMIDDGFDLEISANGTLGLIIVYTVCIVLNSCISTATERKSEDGTVYVCNCESVIGGGKVH